MKIFLYRKNAGTPENTDLKYLHSYNKELTGAVYYNFLQSYPIPCSDSIFQAFKPSLSLKESSVYSPE